MNALLMKRNFSILNSEQALFGNQELRKFWKTVTMVHKIEEEVFRVGLSF